MRHASRSTLLISLSLVACRGSGAHRESAPASAAQRRLSLEQTLGLGEKVDFTGELPRYSWAADGVHLVLEEKDRKVWLDPLTWCESEPPEAASTKEAEDDIVAALVAAGVDEERAAKVRASDRTAAANGGTLVRVEGDLWWAGGGAAHKLASAGDGDIELAELAPDGAWVAFVQGNDLALVETASGRRQQLTRDGSAEILNGKLDWVYQEELYGRGDFKAFWWSPDSRHIAFLRLDETKVYDFTLVDHIEEGHFRVKPEVTRYPKVGDPNPVVALGLADVSATAKVRRLDLTPYVQEEPLIVRVDWAPSGELVYMLQDRVQTWLELCAADPDSGAARVLLRETAPGWVNRPEPARWLADGSFLWLSEHSGQRHVYRHGPDGKLLTTLTAGAWSVGGIEHLDEARGLLWFSAARDGAVNTNLYRVALDGSGLVRLTSGPGRHAPRWNTARTLFLDRVSSLAEAPRLRLCDADGEILRELGAAHAPDLERYATSRWELVTIPARDGFELDAAVLPPVDFDPTRRYPVWLPTYSGPDAPSVANAWDGAVWPQFLAQNGVMVFQVNVRSASGKGQAITASCAGQLGVQELRDLEDAVDWLCRTRAADPARIGITGGSYGGFMAAYALTHSDRFALGLAASGVYDWRMYDTIYTERYMSTPAKNAEGYAKSSVIEAAANLKGHLVITHGEMDDNVHLQNALQLAYALQKVGKDFELMIYPQSRHGLRERALREFDRRLTWRAIQAYLLGV